MILSPKTKVGLTVVAIAMTVVLGAFVLLNRFEEAKILGFQLLKQIPQSAVQFLPNSLPVYELDIEPEKLLEMEMALPDAKKEEHFLEKHQVWKSGSLKYGDGVYNVDVRFRGLGINHWGMKKKSWRVRLKDGMTIGGRGEFDLIVANDRGYAVEQFNNYRAKKLGLAAPASEFVWFIVNGKPHGVYFKVEHWGKDFLETHGMSSDAGLYSEAVGGQLYAPFEASRELWEARVDGMGSWEHLERFLQVVNADDDEFYTSIWKVLDKETFLNWLVHSKLSGSIHQTSAGNVRLYFDPIIGMFKYFPVDVFMYPPDERSLVFHYHPILSRLVADDAFMNEYEGRLREYVLNEKNLEEDLREYDRIVSEIAVPLYQDTMDELAIDQVRNELRMFRELLIENFISTREVLERDGGKAYVAPTRPFDSEPIHPAGGQRSMTGTRMAPAQVVRLSGERKLKGTMVVPLGSTLVIEPGTHISMPEESVILSRGRIIAEGAADEPIRIDGNILVVGTGHDVSTFRHVEFTGGHDGVVEGISYSGMLALHEADARIESCTFRGAESDDAMNVKRSTVLVLHSLFQDNRYDGIDLDWSYGAISGSTFRSNGNDAIDLAGSGPHIESNLVESSGDKCISIGEGSKGAVIANNVLRGCRIGIEIKEGTDADVVGGSIEGNTIGIHSYIKKPAFGAGRIEVFGTELSGNSTDVLEEEGTEIIVL